MKDNLIYSTTTRVVGEKNNIDNFKLGIERLENSKFKYANLNFIEMQELLDEDKYQDTFVKLTNILKETSIIFNIAHAPIHYPFFFNYHYKRNDVDIVEDRIHKAIDISKEIGVKMMVIHVGTYFDENYKYDMEKSIECNIKYLEPFVKKAVENNMSVAIENGTQIQEDEARFEDTAPHIEELIEIVDYFNKKYEKEVMGVCFDFGHANLGKLDMYSELKKIGSRLKATHIHDNYGDDSHSQPFNGNINWADVRKGLSEIDYEGELTSEVKYTFEELSDVSNINKTYDLIEKIHKG